MTRGVADPDLELSLLNQATSPLRTTTLDHDPAQTGTEDLNRLRFISDTFEVFSRHLRDSI
jgi:hypothetical protein